MNLDQDFKEFVEYCIQREVQFLIIGSYALAAHGHPRFTKDLDVWIRIDPQNSQHLLEALSDFDFGSLDLKTEDFLKSDSVVQLGYPPKRIDILTSIDGVSFDDCYPHRVITEIDGILIPFIDAENLKKNKRSTGRTQDLADAEALDE